VDLERVELVLREGIGALCPTPRALTLPDFDRVDRKLRAVLVGVLRDVNR
jgi:hypothetical protein